MLIIGTPHAQGAGHVVNDNRPGGGHLFESAVQTCAHCQAVVELHNKATPYGFCHKCDHVVCASCGKKALTEGCRPFKAVIDRLMAEAHRKQQYDRL